MAYVECFVAPVPTANREAYRAHSATFAKVFREHGAKRVVECWGTDVPDGKLTSLPQAVKLKPDETVVFGWMEWPSRAARDAAFEKAMQDPRMNEHMQKAPFDGKRLIFGGFEPIVEERAP